jgi:hypothetical protein
LIFCFRPFAWSKMCGHFRLSRWILSCKANTTNNEIGSHQDIFSLCFECTEPFDNDSMKVVFDWHYLVVDHRIWIPASRNLSMLKSCHIVWMLAKSFRMPMYQMNHQQYMYYVQAIVRCLTSFKSWKTKETIKSIPWINVRVWHVLISTVSIRYVV